MNTLNIHHLANLLNKAAAQASAIDNNSTEWVNCATLVVRTGDRLIRTARAMGVQLPTDETAPVEVSA